MAILFSSIAYDKRILQKHAIYDGNFIEFVEKFLERIEGQNEKVTYNYNQYLIHYIVENGLIYLCITNQDFERSRSFLFLNEIKRRYKDKFSANLTDVPEDDINFRTFYHVLASEMKHYSESHDIDTIAKVHGGLDELKDIMIKNIDSATARGEELDLLMTKTEELCGQSISFQRRTTTLSRQLQWENIRLYVYFVIFLMVAIYVITALVCGSFNLKQCF